MIDPIVLKMNIQAQLKAIELEDFKTYDLIKSEKQSDKEWLMMYLGLTIDFGNLNEEEKKKKKLNKDYEGKGLDQTAYLEFWQDFTATNKRRNSQAQQSF